MRSPRDYKYRYPYAYCGVARTWSVTRFELLDRIYWYMTPILTMAITHPEVTHRLDPPLTQTQQSLYRTNYHYEAFRSSFPLVDHQRLCL